MKTYIREHDIVLQIHLDVYGETERSYGLKLKKEKRKKKAHMGSDNNL